MTGSNGRAIEAEREEIKFQTWFWRLTHFHGFDRAQSILTGKDEATNADIAKWRALGVRK